MDTGAEAAPAARLLVPFTLGWLAGGLHQADAGGAVLAVAGALVVVVAQMRRRPTRAPIALAGAASGLALGAFASVLSQRPLASDDVARLVGVPVTAVEGTIVRSERQGAGVSLALRAERVRSRRRSGAATGTLGVTIAHTSVTWPSGARVRVVGKLRRPRSFGNPGEYDYAGALRRRGIGATLFLWDEARITRLADPPATASASLEVARTELAGRIARAAGEPVRGYLSAVLLGATHGLDRETRTALTRTGLAHVVSVSGFHVAVAAGACVFALRWLLLRLGTLALRVDVLVVAVAAGVVPVAAYAAIAGGRVPATRAFLTYAVLAVVLAAGRPADAVRALALVALVIASATPSIATDVSFQLSFVSVLALLLVARYGRHRADPAPLGGSGPGRSPGRRWWRSLVVGPVVTSLAASVATAPLTAWHFQQVSLIAPLANLVALPLLGPATLLPGLAALPLVGVLPPVAEALLAVAAAAAGLGLTLVRWLATFPAAAVSTPIPSLLEIGLCYALLALAARRAWKPTADRHARRAALVLALLILGDLGYWVWERCLNPTLRVTFLAVGQGDAAVVELPRGAVMVVDGGGLPGDFDPGERVIAPFLRARKIRRVDVLVVSHPQLDHYGGLAYLAAHFMPAEVWSNGMRSDAAAFRRLERALATSHVRPVVLTRGMERRFGDVRTQVLHPGRLDGLGVNDASLVLKLILGRTSLLFSGDIERVAETQMLADGVDLASDVLKVPHHGSASSSTPQWLAAVAPRIAVVSSGADNRFGFPAPAVVRRLRGSGASVWNTALDGAVRIVSDGHEVTITATRRDVAGERFVFPKSLW